MNMTVPMQRDIDWISDRPEPLGGDLAAVDELLRDRSSLLARIDRGDDLLSIARAMILTVIAAGGAFGAALGAFHGGPQVALAAMKLPLACLLTAAICAPVLTTMNTAIFGSSNIRKDLAVVLCSIALGMLSTFALTPLVLLAACAHVSYPRFVLVVFLSCSFGGIAGLWFFVRSLARRSGEGRAFVGITVLAAFALVGTQGSWTLRPFIAHPGSPIVVVRRVQGNLVDAVIRSAFPQEPEGKAP